MREFTSTISLNSIDEAVANLKLAEFDAKDDKSPSINTELNTFNKDEVIQFTTKSYLRTSEVRGTKAAVAPVMVNGEVRLLYHGSMGRVTPEYVHSDIIGEKAKPTGITYFANHIGFKNEGAKTEFYKVLCSFAGIKAAYEAFAKYEVRVKVIDTTRVETLRFQDEVKTRMQKLMCLEFDPSYTDEELDELYRNLDNAARKSFNKEEIVKPEVKPETEAPEKDETKVNPTAGTNA